MTSSSATFISLLLLEHPTLTLSRNRFDSLRRVSAKHLISSALLETAPGSTVTLPTPTQVLGTTWRKQLWCLRSKMCLETASTLWTSSKPCPLPCQAHHMLKKEPKQIQLCTKILQSPQAANLGLWPRKEEINSFSLKSWLQNWSEKKTSSVWPF